MGQHLSLTICDNSSIRSIPTEGVPAVPALRLGAVKQSISRFDVLGQDGATSQFVRHVGLAAEDTGELQAGASVTVQHMGPPLEHDAEITLHVHGRATLTDDELKQIELFVDEQFGEREAQRNLAMRRFIVRPHADWLREENGTPFCRRFSCAGFVIEAYEEAQVPLLITDEADLPEADWEKLTAAYPEIQRLRDKPEVGNRKGITLDNIGLDGDGPWAVILAGYLFHSLARDDHEIRREPYLPQEGDERFPRQTLSAIDSK